jgi:glucose/arabinose dehydrogenase
MANFRNLAIVAAVAAMAGPFSASGAISGIQRVGTNAFLNFPAFATQPPGDRNRLFVTELGGNIKIIDLASSTILSTPFLTIPDADPAGEGGLLGLAFHPNYYAPMGTPGRGKFYVYVTVDNGGDTSLGVVSPFSSHIREYTVLGDPATSNVADPASKKEILSWVQPQTNHNAGWIGFNPRLTDGQPQYLYIASGDGGGSFDDDAGHTAGTGNAQDITNNLLGKMLRIDVDDDTPMTAPFYDIPPTNPFVGVTGDDEIWAYGLRNPFRDSFDRQTGDLWFGDVGQNQREEIDFQPASSTGGENYGWRYREGTVQTQIVGGPLLPEYTQPVYDYSRGSGSFQGETVIGGYRYRGPDPDLQGRYYFADANDDNSWQMTPPDPVVPNNAVINIDGLLGNLAGVDRIVSFAEDARGNLYLIDMASGTNSAPNPNSGEVYRILTNKLLPGDFDADGDVDTADYDEWQASFGGPLANPAAEGNGNGIADAADYVTWRKNLGSSVHAGAGAGQRRVPEPAAAIHLCQLVGICIITCVGSRRSRRRFRRWIY